MIELLWGWVIVTAVLVGFGVAGYVDQRADALSAITGESAEHHLEEARSAARFTLLAPIWPIASLVLLVRHGVPALVTFVRLAMPESRDAKRERRIRELERELGYLRGESGE